MNDRLVFRKAIKADLPAIIALHETDDIGGHDDAWTLENIPAYEKAMDALLADPSEHLFVAEDQGAVIGSMIATILVKLTGRGRPHMLFRSIQIAPTHRGRGIGTAMLAYAEQESRQWGAVMAELTSNMNRKDAHRFYDRLGYAQSHLGFKKKL